MSPDLSADPRPEPLQSCLDWYAELDRQVLRSGVRDAGATAIPGYPYLRVDRFTASLRDHLADADSPDAARGVRSALLTRLMALDLDARAIELANLPAATRQSLTRPGSSDASGALAHTRSCAEVLTAADLREPARTDRMLSALAVPDDYVTTYRVLGLYPVTRLPFRAGVRQFEARTQRRFDGTSASAHGRTRIRLSPPARPPALAFAPSNLRRMLQPASDDPLQIPSPAPAQLETLFARFAPALDIGVDSEDDLPGPLVWPASAGHGARDPPRVDIRNPVVYRQLAYTRWGRQTLLQLVYTVWFGARPAMEAPIDLLAGHLDGLVWRVTLSPDGEPLVYDSIHPCGCYHLFFPGPKARPRAAPDPQAEWAFSPRSMPPLGPQQHVVLRIAPSTHYLEGLEVVTADFGDRYRWRDYDSLRSLAAQDGRRSVFDPNGFIAGTDRAESWLFWPMGIARAGTMRQWGRQATAFVGRRHFDDARLIEQRFAPVGLGDD